MRKEFTTLGQYFKKLGSQVMRSDSSSESNIVADEKPSLKNRLAKHLVAGAAAVAIAGSANAAIVNWNCNLVPAVDIDGMYINVETQVASNGPGAGVPGWDLNPYTSGTGANWFNSTGGGQMRFPGVTTGPAGNLAFGTTVAATGSWNTATTSTIIGVNPGNWQLNATNYLGFRFVSAAGTTHYGWAKINVGAVQTARTIVQIAYESVAGTSINVGDAGLPSCTAPTLSATTVAALCAGNANGSIDLTATGGSPTPLIYAWSNGGSTEDLSGLTAGTYSVTVTTQTGGCSATGSYTVAEGAANVTYYADADGDTYGDAAVSQISCTGAPVGYVSNSTDCNDASAAVNPGATEVCNSIDDDCDTQIDEGAPLANAGGAAAACGNSFYNLLYQNATGSGGTASWSSTGNGWFQYLTGSGPYTDLSPLYHVGSTDLASGSVTLTLTVTGANGCLTTSSFVLTLVAPPVAVIDPSVVNPWDELHVCAGGSYSFSNAVVSSGANIYWSGGDGSFNSDNIQNPIYTPGPQDISNGDVYIHLNVMSFDGNTSCDNMVDINLIIDPAPAMPTLSCYETASFNPTTCSWDVTATGGSTTYYADVDADGFGDASASIQGYTCVGAPAGYVTDATDCNDNNAAVNSAATEICNSIDDDCDTQIDEGLTFTNYYADVDGDSFGAGTAVNACAQPVGYVLINTDCNDNNGAVNPTATESCSTAFDDNCNGIVNEGCSAIAGDNPSNATSMTTSIWPNCNAVNGTLVNATASGSAQTVCLTGEDKWHQFVATSEGISIVVNSSAADILIELQTAAGVLVAQENAVAGLGGETLNHYGLTAGQVYKIGVRNYNSALGTGTYSICSKMLKRGGCDYGPGPYSLCQYFKATWAGATGSSYTFTFTGVSGPAAGNVYTRTQTSDICVLTTVLPTLPYGSTYSVLITNTYSINNGAGVAETISVPGLAPCSMSTAAQPVTALRTSDRCTAGPRFRGAVVASLPWVCGSTNWRWEFTELDAQSQPVGLPIAVNRGAASNYINLGSVLQLQYGKTYSVRSAPILPYTGTDYQWGTPFCMSIVGSAGMIADGSQAANQAVRVEIANEVNMSLYPNPTHGTDVNINLSGVTSENVQIRVVDAMGRQVWSNRYSVDGILNTNITFERPLANGLYFVEAIYNGELQTQRMMVQK